VKIADFGVARAAAPATAAGARTLIGTRTYLAPERIGGALATPANDLYSLGIVARECLTSAPPFTGIGGEAVVARRDCPPLPLAVPAQVAALVAGLTARNPAARPSTASEAARPGPGSFAMPSPAARPGGRAAGRIRPRHPDTTLGRRIGRGSRDASRDAGPGHQATGR